MSIFLKYLVGLKVILVTLACFQGTALSQSALPALPTESQLTSPITNVELDSYILGAGDLVRLEVFQLPDHNGDYRILSDGSINLPLLGRLDIAGMTLSQTAAAISQTYSRILHRPAISLDLVESRPLDVVIVGEVNRPGPYQIPSEDNVNQITVTQIIELAGGITNTADIQNVTVRRPKANSNSEFEDISLDLWSLIRSGNGKEDLLLQDGDSIYIPKVEAINPAETVELASASFSPDSINIYVVGEVPSPGLQQLPPKTSLGQAVLAAGGFTNRSDDDEVELVRLNPDGTFSRRTIEVDLGGELNSNGNPLLFPNDTIVVGRSNLTEVTDVLGVLLSPINTGLLLLDRIF